MAFQVDDLRDLIELLAEKPEWRAQLRPLILGDEFDRLPRVVEELAEAQRRTEARVEELAEAQRRTEKRVEELTARVEDLAEAQGRTEARIEDLVEAQRRTETRLQEMGEKIDALTASIKMLSDQFTDDTGALYEVRFERKAPSLFGQWLRKPRVVSLNDLERVDEAEMTGALSPFDASQLRALDIIIQGLDKRESGYPETLLAVEVSRTLNDTDLDRAEARAKLLAGLGYRALPAVGGKFATERLMNEAERRGILLRLIDQLN
ncbi:MAG: hypothetical protein M5U18_16795 [Dehalococcoidia bacterium]|nr:hypothetical protein [Dehalococcoidia bacterium]